MELNEKYILETPTVHTDPILKLSEQLQRIDNEVKGPISIPVGNVPYEVLEWNSPKFRFRLLKGKSNHTLSVVINDNRYYLILSDSETSSIPELTEDSLADIGYYTNESPETTNTDEMTLLSDDSDSVYTVNLKDVTCTCRNFKFKRSHYTPDREERLCKHLQRAFQTYPDRLPDSILRSDEVKHETVNHGYPRSLVEVYVLNMNSMISGVLTTWTVDPTIKYNIVGEYRRCEKTIKSVEYIVGSLDTSLVERLKSIFAINGYEIQQDSDNDHLHYIVDGWLSVNIKFCSPNEFATQLVYNTGPKDYILMLVNKASSLGFNFSMHGILNPIDNVRVPMETEQDVFKFLGVPYTLPWERG